MPKIFISYRREDSQYQADRLHAALSRHVSDPERDIFIDVENIPVGVDFVEHLDGQIAQCDVLLAVIGPTWLNAGAGILGGRRLDDPKDFVRLEIASALKRGIPVAPILLDGVAMPGEDQLPPDLKPLARRNAVEVRRATFDVDTERMIRGLRLSKANQIRRDRSDARERTPLSAVWIAALVAFLAVGGFVAWTYDVGGIRGNARGAVQVSRNLALPSGVGAAGLAGEPSPSVSEGVVLAPASSVAPEGSKSDQEKSAASPLDREPSADGIGAGGKSAEQAAERARKSATLASADKAIALELCVVRNSAARCGITEAKIGEVMTVRITSPVSGRLVLVDHDANYQRTQVFPNGLTQSGSTMRVLAGTTVELPSNHGFAYRVSEPAGASRLMALVVPESVALPSVVAQNAKKRGIVPIPAAEVKEFDAAIAEAQDVAGFAIGEVPYVVVR